MILRAYNWWSEGLAAGLSGLANAVRPPRRFQLHTDAQSVLLRTLDKNGSRSVIRLADGLDGGLPADILRQIRGSVVEIVIPTAAILERRLDLPSESRPYVEQVVRHQIEALFPWRAADVVYASRIQDCEGGRLEVTVRATARPAIAKAIGVASACSASEVSVSGEETAERGVDAASIPIAVGPAGRDRLRHSRMIARYAIIALLLATVGVLGVTTWMRWSLETDIALLDQAIADRRAVLQRASKARAQADGGLEAKKQEGVVAVATLDALSSILPDATYLTDLSLDAGRVRMTGVSASATELVPLLEGSGRFRNASFYAPMTRLSGQATDRFSIEAVIVPPMEVKP